MLCASAISASGPSRSHCRVLTVHLMALMDFPRQLCHSEVAVDASLCQKWLLVIALSAYHLLDRRRSLPLYCAMPKHYHLPLLPSDGTKMACGRATQRYLHLVASCSLNLACRCSFLWSLCSSNAPNCAWERQGLKTRQLTCSFHRLSLPHNGHSLASLHNSFAAIEQPILKESWHLTICCWPSLVANIWICPFQSRSLWRDWRCQCCVAVT